MKFSDAEIQTYFNKILHDDKNISAGIAAIMTLLEVLQRDDATTTITELRANFVEAINAMKKCDQPTTSVSSGCALFLRFITLVEGLDAVSFAKCKEIMADRGKLFLGRLHEARGKVAQQASSFISDGCKILTHSKSRVVLETIRQAVQQHKRFKVYVTTSSPDNAGIEMYEILCKEGVDCTLILDASVGYILEQVDLVMFGAEGVAESGGIINKIGTYTIAMCAKELKKPVYVLTESFKFNRVYPLNQKDLPNEFKYLSSTLNMKDFSKEHPLVDYTPPSYITLLFTDIGILTPSAVSDELIKLYL